MRTAVIYKSISGFTKTYAEWIAEDLGADLFALERVPESIFSDYGTIVFGGSLHAVGLNGVKFLNRNFEKLAGKKLVVFAVGASPNRDGIPEEVLNKNFTAERRKGIAFFYFRGGFDFSKLDLPNRILMTVFKWSLKRKKTRTADEQGMLDAYDKPADFTDRGSVEPLVEYVRSLG